ncbi:MAG: WG repeat-containing protein [Spirochaetaceae bacterium]|nr:MAG: WG repeat-containing protein [Spirochaetaceae bacterium]
MNHASRVICLCALMLLMIVSKPGAHDSHVRRFAAPYSTAEGRRFGYVDAGGGLRVSPDYLVARAFQGGYAVVATSRSRTVPTGFGVIDPDGRFVAPAVYDDILLSWTGKAWVLHDGAWRYIRVAQGDYVFPGRFDRVTPYSEGMAVVEAEGEQLVIDNGGRRLFSLTARGLRGTLVDHGNPAAFPHDVSGFREGLLMAVSSEPAAGLRSIVFLDADGNVVIPARTYLAEAVNSFSEGYAALQEYVPGVIGGGDAFFIDRHGSRGFGGKVWRGVKSFSEGRAAVTTRSASSSQNRPARWGFINHEGELVIADVYLDVEPFSEGLAAVAVELDSLVSGRRDGLWGAIDRHGTMVIEPQFRSPFRFRDGLAQVLEPIEVHSIAGVQLSAPARGMRTRYIDRSGRIVWDERDHVAVE